MEQNSNTISFWNLIRGNKIVIPIIQRDYAQGRLGKETLRQKFLQELEDALDNNHGQRLTLDFVYGVHCGSYIGILHTRRDALRMITSNRYSRDLRMKLEYHRVSFANNSVSLNHMMINVSLNQKIKIRHYWISYSNRPGFMMPGNKTQLFNPCYECCVVQKSMTRRLK